MTPTRREFLAVTAATPLLMGAAPPARAAAERMTLGVAAYSFRQALDLKKPTMTLFDFIDLAATLPVECVELTSYYWAETTAAYIAKLKARAAAKKLAASGVPIRSDFCVADPAKLRGEVAHVKTWTDRAADLGAATVRVFAGTYPKGADPAATRRQVIACLEECAEHAGKRGVVIAVENHHGITGTPADLLALVEPVKSKAIGVNADTGNFRTADPYADLAKVLPRAVVVQVKTEIFPNGGPAQEADLAKVVGLLHAAAYRGPVVLEYEAKPDAKLAVPKHLARLRTLIDAPR